MAAFLKTFVAACCGRDASQVPPAEGRPTSGETVRKKSTGARKSFTTNNDGKIDEFYKRDKKKLGEGSYGTVTIAEHKATSQKRAVKEIKRKSMKSKQQEERLKVEIDIMQSMDHPGIVKLYETFQDSNNIYLVMELSKGGELFDAITDPDLGGHFGERDAAIIMQQMISGIFYLHSNLVCHRDLKPENFLFQFPKPTKLADNNLKLIDFGLSCRYKTGQRFKTKAGTPYYVAPQVLGGDYDQASDLWSCGVIMYVLLCGYPPFYAESDNEVLSLVKKGKYSYQPQDWKSVSSDAKNLIDGLLKFDERARFDAETALKHKWVKEKAPGAKNVPLKADFVTTLRRFAGQNKLKKAALHVIAGQLSEPQIKNMRDLFKSLDANGDGMLSLDEIRNGVEKAGIKMAPDLQHLIQDMDSDGSGAIDYSEFIAATIDMKTATQQEQCWAAFCVFDKDKNGKISLSELKALLEEEGVSAAMGQQTAEDLMKQVDSDGNGEIDFKEFMTMMQAK